MSSRSSRSSHSPSSSPSPARSATPQSPSESTRSSPRSSPRSSRSASPPDPEPESSPAGGARRQASVLLPASPRRELTIADEAAQLLRLTIKGDVAGARSVLKAPPPPTASQAAAGGGGAASATERARQLLSHHHSAAGGNVVHVAAHSDKMEMLSLFAEECPDVFRALSVPVALRMVHQQRFAAVSHLTTLNPAIATAVVDESSGDHLLHVACSRRRPPSGLLQRLLRDFHATINVNERNDAGMTPLHLVACRSSGVEGREVARLLLRHGADESQVDASGRTALECATNPFVRQTLGLTAGVKARMVPAIDDASRAEIDACADSSQFPPVKDLTAEIRAVTPALLAVEESEQRRRDLGGTRTPLSSTRPTSSLAGAAASGGRGVPRGQRRPCRLSSEAAEAMVHRLFEESTERHHRWYEEQISRVMSGHDKGAARKALDAESLEAAVARLYDDEMSRRSERRQELLDKYIHEPPPGPELTATDVDEASNRLCRASMQRKEKIRDELMQRYAPSREERRLTKAELESSAVRLHDESCARTKEKFDALYAKYLSKPQPARLSKQQMAAMAARLSQRK